MASFGALRYPRKPLLGPYWAHALCPNDLCPDLQNALTPKGRCSSVSERFCVILDERIDLLTTVERQGHLSGKPTLRTTELLPRRRALELVIQEALRAVRIAHDVSKDNCRPARSPLNASSL